MANVRTIVKIAILSKVDFVPVTNISRGWYAIQETFAPPSIYLVAFKLKDPTFRELYDLNEFVGMLNVSMLV